MATPRVSLKSRTLADGTTIYYLDYRVNGKRMRPAVGTNKRDAEFLRASIEHDLLLGTYQIRKSRRSISLEGLEFDACIDFLKQCNRRNNPSARGWNSHNYKECVSNYMSVVKGQPMYIPDGAFILALLALDFKIKRVKQSRWVLSNVDWKSVIAGKTVDEWRQFIYQPSKATP